MKLHFVNYCPSTILRKVLTLWIWSPTAPARVPLPDRLRPTQYPIQWVPGALPSGCETDHTPKSSAEVKNAW